MSDERMLRLGQLRHALDLGAIDMATFNLAAAALGAPAAAALGAGATAVGAGGVAVMGANSGAINTGTIENIAGDKIQINVQIARAIFAASLLTPQTAANEPRRRAIADYYRKIAATLTEVAAALRQAQIPHGKCGEMLGYAEQLPAQIGDFVGAEQTHLLADKLKQAYDVESFYGEFGHLLNKDAKFSDLDRAAGYFSAAADSLLVGG